MFSLFNVVQFQNEGCNSRMMSTAVVQANSKNPVPSTTRQGVCFSAQECIDRAGTASGSCAAGFGVCCVIVARTGGTITQNCTYLQNPGFPAAYAETNGVQYTINKMHTDVCSLRLDFDTFTTLGPAGTGEVGGGACRDTLTITATSAGTLPVLCGRNAGQHVYIDLGQNAGDSATLNFAFPGAANNVRMWDIKATQVKCGRNNPPTGCFQYFTENAGTIQTFNFADAMSSHLNNQMYTSCIRQNAGFCCIQYSVCPGLADAFTLNTVFGVNKNVGNIEAMCNNDYVRIPGASDQCNVGGKVTNTVNKICGSAFTVAVGKNAQNIPICDCSPPFQVSFITDNLPDVIKTNNVISRGACLCYTQLPC